MDRDQCYTILIGLPGAVEALKDTTFQVSQDRTFWFGRYTSTIRLGGSGWDWSLEGEAATPLHEIAGTVKKLDKKLEQIGKGVETIGRRLRPKAEGGDQLVWKTCADCGWDRFTYARYLGGARRFICANCGATFKTDCGCTRVVWCEHGPTPAQSTLQS